MANFSGLVLGCKFLDHAINNAKHRELEVERSVEVDAIKDIRRVLERDERAFVVSELLSRIRKGFDREVFLICGGEALCGPPHLGI